MDDLVAFLTARLGEDEAAAKAASPGPWFQDGTAIRSQPRLYAPSAGPTLVVKHTWPQEAAHILLHDPARVLRDVEARRKILAVYEEALRIQAGFRETSGEETARLALEMAVRALAAVYPDYRKERA